MWENNIKTLSVSVSRYSLSQTLAMVYNLCGKKKMQNIMWYQKCCAKRWIWSSQCFGQNVVPVHSCFPNHTNIAEKTIARKENQVTAPIIESSNHRNASAKKRERWYLQPAIVEFKPISTKEVGAKMKENTQRKNKKS